jgi:hypothetical protein
MKKYEIEATRVDEYRIEVDETIWTEEEIKKWASCFWSAETPEDIARHLASSIMHLGSDHGFYEGFGYVKIYIQGRLKTQYKSGFEKLEDDEYTKGISINVITEAEDYDYEVKSIK